ncbi:MAG TPA: adenylate/guanylate cyclase domain-containing protein [Candidatus Limnocylindrales bacterium]|nr:adenylate/guanylate cyclase domain-containing protein [Candidatus Limnocylindrales bacterium]
MQPRPVAQPTGTVTFLFSDIEGSTKLVERLGDGWPDLLERHRRAMRAAFETYHGFEQGTEGDSFFVVFGSATDAVAAAVQAQRALAAEAWPADGRIRVRMGLHTGDGRLSGGDYVGLDVHRAARIGAAGHGGQVLLSETTASLAGASLPAGVRLVDLGLHRLKDMPRPERIRQLAIDGLAAEFPALRSLEARASNLPVALSSLVGREADVAAVRDRLRESRLVTVIGPGGTGKSRLVQEVAREVAAELDGGATFVPLDALRDAALIPTEILRAMRLDIASSTPPIERLAEAVGDRRTLLVLDNLEQLAGAGAIVRDLLGAIPSLMVLASSQAALRVAGEQEYSLQPLPADDAVRLFVERARAVRPDFSMADADQAAIVAIVERLDGLPLAVELAAAQVRMLPPAAILARVSDRIDAVASRQQDLPARQRTLRGAVTWSYELLSPGEQALFRRLSVFVGGATIADIEAFEGCRGRAFEALETLEGLVDRSLVVVRRTSAEEHRFVQLQTIRSVARERLQAAGEEVEALADHATVFEQLAIQAEPRLYGSGRRAWLDRLAAEHDNLRAAIDRDLAAGNLEGALEIASRIWRFWQTRGHLVEARGRLGVLLDAAAARDDLSPLVLSRAEEAAGSVAYWMRNVAAADVEPHYRRSLELARQSGDRDREAWAIYNLAFVFDFIAMTTSEHYDRERGASMRAEALDIFRAVGDKRGIGESLWALGGNAIAIEADADEARDQLEEAAAVLAEIGDSYGASWAHMSLGMLEMNNGRLAEGREAILKGTRIFLADDDVTGEIVAMRALAALATLSGDDSSAVRIEAAAQQAARRIGVDPPEINPIVAPIVAARSRLAPDAVAREEAAAESIEPRAFLESMLAESDTVTSVTGA